MMGRFFRSLILLSMGVAKKDVYKKSGKLVILPKKILMSFAKLVSQNVETMNVASLILLPVNFATQKIFFFEMWMLLNSREF